MLLENYPKNSTGFYLMGCIQEKKGEIPEGIEYFNKAIEIDPNNVFALFSRGACYNMLGNYEKAIEDYSLALEKDSNRNGKKTILRNIGKVLGLNNENLLTTNSSNFANNNMNLSGNPFNEERSSLDINNSSYFNLNNSKTIENLNMENEMNKFINNQLRDIMGSSAGVIPNNILLENLNINDKKENYKNDNSQGYNGIVYGNGKSNNSNNNTSINNYSKNSNLNFYNGKNDSFNQNININNIGASNNRLKGNALDSNFFSNLKKNSSLKQNGNNDLIPPDEKINSQFASANNKNINLNSLLGQNINPNDIDNLILSLKNNNIIKDNSGIYENLKSLGLEAAKKNAHNPESLQKNFEEYTPNSNSKSLKKFQIKMFFTFYIFLYIKNRSKWKKQNCKQ